MAPDERLRFSDLVVRVDKTLQSVAGYVELSMTLEKLGPGEEKEEDWTGYEVIEPVLHEAGKICCVTYYIINTALFQLRKRFGSILILVMEQRLCDQVKVVMTNQPAKYTLQINNNVYKQ